MKTLISCMTVLSLAFAGLPAAAKGKSKGKFYPTAEIDRPLALPQKTLEARGGFNFDIIDQGDNWFSFALGAGYGIIKDLEAGLGFPLMLSPEVKAGDFSLYGLYEFGPFMGDKVYTAGRLSMIIPMSNAFFYTYPATNFAMIIDAPAKFKFHKMIAATAGLGMGFAVGDQDDVFVFNFDLGMLFQPTDPLAISLQFGVHAFMGDPDVTNIPLMFRGQYTLIGDLDLFLDFGFPDLNELGGDWVQFLFGAAYRIGV